MLRKFISIVAGLVVVTSSVFGSSAFGFGGNSQSNLQAKNKVIADNNSQNGSLQTENSGGCDNNIIVKSSMFEGQLISNIKQLNSNTTLVLAHKNGSSTPYIATAQNKGLNFTNTFEPAPAKNAIISLYVSHGLGVISVGEGSASYVYYTTDGYQWKEVDNFYWASEMVYGNGFWYVIGSSADNHGYPTVWSYSQTSGQGGISNIVDGGSENDNELQALVFNNKLYVSYIDQNVNTHVLVSDLVSTPSFSKVNALDGGQNFAIFQNRLYVAGTQILAYSEDGVNWTYLERGMNYFSTRFYQTKDFLYYGNNNAVTLNTWSYYLVNGNKLVRTNWASNEVKQVLETSNTIFASEVDSQGPTHWYQTTFDSPSSFKESSFLSSHNVKEIALINNYLYAISSKDAYYSDAQSISFKNFVCQKKWVANQTNFAYIFRVDNLVYFSSSEPTFELWMVGTSDLFHTTNSPVFLEDSKPLTLNFKSKIDISFFQKGIVQSVSINGASVSLPSVQTISKSNTEMTIVVQGGQELDFLVVIKSSFDESNVTYSVKDDTILNNSLVSNNGNTVEDEIVQTMKKSSAQGPCSIMINLKPDTYVRGSSFYQKGVMKNNNFSGEGSKTYFSTDQASIIGDGFYLVQVVDKFGYTYKAILEQGKQNWITSGQPSGAGEKTYLAEADSLNTKVLMVDGSSDNITNFNSWIVGAQGSWNDESKDILNNLVKQYGQGFDNFGSVLDNVNKNEKKYFEKTTIYRNLNSLKPNLDGMALKADMISLIKAEVSSDIKNGIEKDQKLAEKLLISGQNNIHTASDLSHYQNFVEGYDQFLSKQYDSKWFDSIIRQDGLGFLNKYEVQQLETKYNLVNLEEHYLKKVKWNPNLKTNYNSYVEIDKFKADLEKDVQSWYHPNKQLANDIAKEEKGVNLYGHNVRAILSYKHKKLPANKAEMTNFDGHGTSFHNWLVQASKDYNSYLAGLQSAKQERMIWIAVGGSLGAVALIAGAFWWMFRVRIRAFYRRNRVRRQKELIRNDK